MNSVFKGIYIKKSLESRLIRLFLSKGINHTFPEHQGYVAFQVLVCVPVKDFSGDF